MAVEIGYHSKTNETAFCRFGLEQDRKMLSPAETLELGSDVHRCCGCLAVRQLRVDRSGTFEGAAHAVERFEDPLNQTAAVEQNVGIHRHARLECFGLAVSAHGLLLESNEDAIERLGDCSSE